MMFEVRDKYSEEVQNLINEIEEKQSGVQVIKVKYWSLPIWKYAFELEISKAKSLNIIEEFILKIALAFGPEVTEEVIQSMLGLDEVFTSKFINRLADAGVVEKKKLPNIEITQLGRQQFEKGQVLTKDRKETVSTYIQPNFKLFYSDVKKQKSAYPLMTIPGDDSLDELTVASVENDSKLVDQVINTAKEDKVIVNRESVNQFVSKINSVTPIGKPDSINFVEFWIYDIIEERLYCRVWDCQKLRYNEELSEFITETQPLSKNDFEIKDDLSSSMKTITNKYEEIFKEEVKAQRSDGPTEKLTLRMVRGGEIKKEFDQCLKSTKNYLYIQSPWISDYVVDNKMITLFKNLVNKKCKIFISWGIARDINKEDRKPDQELIDQLRDIKSPSGLPGIFIYWIGNHHNKEIMVDDRAHLAGSFNWLSYRGDYLPRGESVYITNDKSAIQDAKIYWESQLFKKISSQIWVENYIREIHTLINIETLGQQVKELMLTEVNKLINQRDNDRFDKLYNVSLIYFRNELFDEVFTNIITYLIEKKKYLKEIYIMLNYLKKNNSSEIYETIVLKFKDVFIESKIVDNSLKPEKLLTKKNAVKGLAFTQNL